MKTDHTLLTVQKLIYLLDDFHFNEFAQYLKKENARLPLKLIEAVRNKLPEFDKHEELCRKVYNSYDTSHRQSFNQLASYTFKLSKHLALNYPSYLTHNHSAIQRLVNEGNMQQADFLARNLLEVAERIEDYQTQIFATKYFMQQAFLYKDITQGTKLSQRLDIVYAAEKMYTDIIADLRYTLNISVTGNQSLEELETHKKKFESLYTSNYATVRMLSRYAYVYIVYYFQPEQLADRHTLETMYALERDLENFSYVVFPFMFDLRSNAAFLKLNSTAVDMSTKEGKKQLAELEAHNSEVMFWKNYLNMPQIFGITAKASYYLSKYHRHLHKPEYQDLVGTADMEDIRRLCKVCEDILHKNAQTKYYKNDLINLQLLYGSLLILTGGKGIQKGAQELESLLVSYQQVNLSVTNDSIFICLMLAYFAQKQYEKCSDTFKRYLKITKGKPMYEDNDINIHTYYYLAQWLFTERKQYLEKLKTNYERSLNSSTFDEPRKSILEFIEYFKIPITI